VSVCARWGGDGGEIGVSPAGLSRDLEERLPREKFARDRRWFAEEEGGVKFTTGDADRGGRGKAKGGVR
jgi:hypothetical protein